MNSLNLNKSIAGFLFFILISVLNALAQETISAKELEKIYQNDDVSIIYTGTEEGYEVHIPNAVFIPHQILCNQEPVKNRIKTPELMAQILGENGISADKTLIVYDDGAGKSAARMYWILNYLGEAEVKVLDGNLEAWQAAKNQVAETPSILKPVTFTARPDASMLATTSEVKKAIDNASYVIIDARTPEEFNGTNDTELRKGHIPSAVNLNYENVRDENGMIKQEAELKSMFESKGITPDKKVITYCASGVRASSIFLALRQLDYPNVKVYDGSFLEWERHTENPVGRQ